MWNLQTGYECFDLAITPFACARVQPAVKARDSSLFVFVCTTYYMQVRNQRLEHANYLKGKKSRMTAERYHVSSKKKLQIGRPF